MIESSNFRESQKKSDMFGHFHSDHCRARLSIFNLDVRFKERYAWITNQRMRNVQIIVYNFQLIFNQTQ